MDQPGHYRFSHALIQETLYSELTTSRRLRLHSTVGAVLETLHANNLAPSYAELAHHFSESALAGNTEKAVDYAIKAGDQAMARAAWESAVAYFERSLDLVGVHSGGPNTSTKIDLLLACSDAHWSSGNSEPGKRLAFEAARLARALEDSLRLAKSALFYAGGRDLVVWIPDPVATDLIDEALDQLTDDEDHLRARLLARYAHFSEPTQDLPNARDGEQLRR